MWVSCSTCIIILGSSWARKVQVPWVVGSIVSIISYLFKLVVHGHRQGTRLNTCLMYAACVVAFVECVNGDNFSIMYLILLKSVVYAWTTHVPQYMPSVRSVCPALCCMREW